MLWTAPPPAHECYGYGAVKAPWPGLPCTPSGLQAGGKLRLGTAARPSRRHAGGWGGRLPGRVPQDQGKEPRRRSSAPAEHQADASRLSAVMCRWCATVPCAWAEPSLYCASHKAVPMFIETSVPREVCVGVKSLLLGALSFDPRVCQMARPSPHDDEPSWRDGPDCFWSGPSSCSVVFWLTGNENG